MRARAGHLGWWPGETPFEVCIGAILTQNTNWTNVEKALANLRQRDLLHPARLYALPAAELAELLRPSGYFNLKADRVRSFLKVLEETYGGDLTRLMNGSTPSVRQRLLAIRGIGPETADSMMLYAGGHASFVIDAYTRRIFHRHGWCREDATYQELQTLCCTALSGVKPARRLDYWQDYHAQLVGVAKHFCLKRGPRCEVCPLAPLLPAGTGSPRRASVGSDRSDPAHG